MWDTNYITAIKYVMFELHCMSHKFITSSSLHVSSSTLPNQDRQTQMTFISCDRRIDQWQASSSVGLANRRRRGLFERWKAGWLTFERETKREPTSRYCWTRKPGIVVFFYTRIHCQLYKVILKHNWMYCTTPATFTLAFIDSQLVGSNVFFFLG